MVKVNNCSKGYAARYIVARWVDGELWFWGGYNAYEKALMAACDIDGVMLTHEEVDWTV